jgi:hypothetical protein
MAEVFASPQHVTPSEHDHMILFDHFFVVREGRRNRHPLSVIAR